MYTSYCHANIGHLLMLLIWPVMLLTWKHAFHTWQQHFGAIVGDVLKTPAQEGHHRYNYVAVLKLHSQPVTTSNITSEHNYAKNLVHPSHSDQPTLPP